MNPEDKKYLYPTNYIPTGKEDNSSQIPGQIAGTAAILGGGAGAVGGGMLFAKPWMQKSALLAQKQQLINNSVKPFMQRYNIPNGIPINSLQSHLGDRTTELNTIIAKQNQVHGDTMNKFDSNLNKIANDIGDNLSENYPSWKRSVSVDYGKQLNALEERISKMGVSFDADSFNKNVIQKTADSLESRGMVSAAEKLRDYASRELLDNNGNPNTKPISFSNAKQAVASIVKNDPVASMELKSNWVDTLNNHPALSQVPSLSSDLQTLNSKYAQAAKVSNYIYQKKIVDPKSQEFNTENATREIQDYVKGNGNPALPDALRIVGNKTPLGIPMPNASDHASQLEQLAKERADTIAQHSTDTATRAMQVETLAPAKTQAGILSDTLNGLNQRIEDVGKSIEGRIAAAKGLGAVGLGLAGLGAVKNFIPGASAGIIQNKLMEGANGGINPIDQLNAMGTGMFGNDQQKQDLMNKMQQAYQQSQQT